MGRTRSGATSRFQDLASRVGSRLHPADRSRLRRLVKGRPQNLGLLSVIVPVYDVERYLAACLASIVSQSYPFLELIVIDDGSSDGSLDIVEDFARRDRRIRVLEIPHGGNGRARNAGLQLATGKYITFADSDDIVAPDAYRVMITKLHTTSSQFVVGSSDRLAGRKRTRVRMMEKLHAVPRERIRLTDYPEILSDVFLWNKVFRRDFWDSAVATIPQDVLYEDQETTARAYVKATAFDVIPEVVYSWRIRQDATSITQGKHSIRDLKDRLDVVSSVTRLLLAECGPDVLMPWFTRVLGADLVPYFELVPHSDEDYWLTLRAGLSDIHASVQGLGAEFSDAVTRSLGPHEQVLGTLVARGARADFDDVLIHRSDNGPGFEVQVRGDRLLARLEYLEQLRMPHVEDLVECPAWALIPVSEVSALGWTNEGALLVSGHFYLLGLDSAEYPGVLRVQLVDTAGNCLDLKVERCNNPRIDTVSNDPYASHSAAAFTCTVDADHARRMGPVVAKLVVTLAVAQEVYEVRHVLRLPPRGPQSVAACSSPKRPVVTEVAFDEDHEGLSVCVSMPRSARAGGLGIAVALVTARNIVHPTSVDERAPDARTFNFSLERLGWGKKVAAPYPGAYTLRYVEGGGTIDQASLPVMIDEQRVPKLPLEREFPHAALTVFRVQSGACAVAIAPPLASGERGKFNQRQLRLEYAAKRAPVALTDVVLFESFGGKSCTDSPRALSDVLHDKHPEAPIYWSIADYSVEYPAYASPVLRGSREWFTLLRSSRTLVNNNNFPLYFRKFEGQRYIQTWHGTPLKKLARDAPTRYLSASYRRTIEREAQMWDVLLAQNVFASQVLPEAFGYTGRVLTTGYPRNDALLHPGRESRAKRVRQALGIAQGRTVVLYAPTWRDDARNGARGHSLVTHLDFVQAGRMLGPDHVFLIRGHHNVTPSSSAWAGANVIDVSLYPEINDLILVSDLLVTDYSSISFDYCVTDKPIFFLVPDLGQYRDETRGFYLDWEVVAPGPLCKDTAELCKAIQERDNRSGGEAYARFKDCFAPMDDGGASERVLKAIWPSGEEIFAAGP